MIYVNEAYKKACEENFRESYVIAKYGNYDKIVKTKIQTVSGGSKFSNPNKIYNDIRETNYNYISCEPNRIKLDNTFYFLLNKEKNNPNEYVAFWGQTFNEDYCNIYFRELISTDNIVFTFQEICPYIEVSYIQDETGNTRNSIITSNDKLIVSVELKEQFKGFLFDHLQIKFIPMENRYVKLNEIDFGEVETFTNKEIIDFNVIDELSIDSSELSANSLELTIDDTKGEYDVLNPNNKLSKLQEKQEITLYHYLKVGNNFKEIPLGTFLLKEFQSQNNKLKLEAYDDTYFMNQIYYGSKYYDNVEIKDILLDLFNYFNYTNYIIDDELTGIKLKGFIPIVEFREALRLIAEASCCVINKTRYGKTYIFKTYDKNIKTFNKRNVFKENHSKNLFNNSIDVVEYNYTNLEQNYEIYNSELDVGEHIVVFNEFPIKEETITKSDINNNDYSIIETYTTTCLIKVTKKTNVILKATLIKTTSVVNRKQKIIIDADEYSIRKVDNYLVTSENSNIVANWKLGRGDIKYNFDTLVIPYIEVGDTCEFKTRFNTTNTFIPTKLEFNKSLLQNIEGE